MTQPIAIRVRDLVVGFGDHTVLDRVSVEVARGEIFGFVGGSGSGKSVLLRTIIGLIPAARAPSGCWAPSSTVPTTSAARHRAPLGVLFQQGALFSSLSVVQNVEFPMREYLSLSKQLMREMAEPSSTWWACGRPTGTSFPPSFPAA